MLPFLFLVSFIAVIGLIMFALGTILDFRRAKTITKNLNRFISYEEFNLVIVGLQLNPFKGYSSVAFDKYIKFLDPLTKQLFIYLNIDFNNSNKFLQEDYEGFSKDFKLKLVSNFNLDKLSVEDAGILMIDKLPSIVSLSMGFNYSLENPPTEKDLGLMRSSINENNFKKYFLSKNLKSIISKKIDEENDEHKKALLKAQLLFIKSREI